MTIIKTPELFSEANVKKVFRYPMFFAINGPERIYSLEIQRVV